MKATEYSDLPSELIDEIFDVLWDITYDERALLRNCLPVSTDFRHRIMSRFCSFVYLSDDSDRGVILRKLISRPPDSRLGGIGRYIEHFCLILHPPDQGDVSDSGITRQLMHDSDLVAIVEGLYGDDFGVTEFSLTIPTECLVGLSALWTDLPASFRSAFQSLLHSPYLTRLNLENIAVPVRIFRGSFLEDLSIEHASILGLVDITPEIQELDPVPVSVSPFPSLVTLCADYSHEFYSTPFPDSMLDKLKIFTEVPNKISSSERTWHILGVSASSLTEISIDHTGELQCHPLSGEMTEAKFPCHR